MVARDQDLHCDGLHCVELNTGRRLTGTLQLSSDSLQARIHSYDEHFFIDDSAPIFLLTEANTVVSLHDNVGFSPDVRMRRRDPLRTITSQTVISNAAVVGPDEWPEDRKVARVTFAVGKAGRLLKNRAKLRSLNRLKFSESPDLLIFEDVVGNMTLKAFYSPQYGPDFDSPKDIQTRLEIEFINPEPLHQYINHVVYYAQFFSFCAGIQLRPSDIFISQLTKEEWNAALGERSYSGDHTALYLWPDVEDEKSGFHHGDSPVIAWSDDELDAFRRSVVVWFERICDWSNAYHLMWASLKARNEMSADRLLTACRWLEKLPNGRALKPISKEHIEAIASAAAEQAAVLGYSSATKGRIAGCIKRVKEETHSQRFARLLDLVQPKFRNNVLPDGALDDLQRAMKLRGLTAHGRVAASDGDAFEKFALATMAVEALCYLLTAIDLPLSPDGRKRATFNPVVQDYRNAKSQSNKRGLDAT